MIFDLINLFGILVVFILVMISHHALIREYGRLSERVKDLEGKYFLGKINKKV